jgi:hypothetical protein
MHIHQQNHAAHKRAQTQQTQQSGDINTLSSFGFGPGAANDYSEPRLRLPFIHTQPCTRIQRESLRCYSNR